MAPDHPSHLGQLLEARRKARGLSQHGLARAAGINQSTVLRLETGEIAVPSLDKLGRLAQVLDISGADVFALAGYSVSADLPSLRPYLQAKFSGLLCEDIDKIETYVGRLAKKRGVDLAKAASDGASTK